MEVVVRDKRCKPGHQITVPSYDCRACRKEVRRARRRQNAEAAGKSFEPRGDRAHYEAMQRARREQLKRDRKIAWSICLAFWRLRSLCKVPKKQDVARMVARQRWRRHNDPDYWAARKALKIKRKRAMDGAQVEAVSLLCVAERDNWTCYLCHRVVERHTHVVRDQWSMEHVVPLSKGGSHTYDNVRLAHRGCNSRKGAKQPSTTSRAA